MLDSPCTERRWWLAASFFGQPDGAHQLDWTGNR
jgi:hypothetical protein